MAEMMHGCIDCWMEIQIDELIKEQSWINEGKNEEVSIWMDYIDGDAWMG